MYTKGKNPLEQER